ncbi:glycosyltransferase [Enterococcus olivae]
MQTSKKIKIDLVAVPFSGHLYPLLELVKPLLKNEKYEFRLFTGMQKVEIASKLGLKVIPLFPDEPTKMETIANTSTQISPLGMYQQLKQNMTIIPEVIEFLNKEIKENQTDLVIADFVAVPAGIVCKQLDIPWITTIPTPFAIESRSETPSYLGGWRPKKTSLGKRRDYFGRKTVRTFKKLVVWLLKKPLAPYDFQLYNDKDEETIYSPYSILGLGMKEMEFRTDFPAQFQWAGPCCASFETAKINLDSKKHYVLVTIGTHLLWGKDELLQLVSSLAEKHPQLQFLVSLGDTQQEAVISKIKENVTVYGYLPYSQVLPQVDYVIHHGGAGILYHCIKEQLPALILPHDYDQFDYAARAEWAGVALVANRNNTQQILKNFQKLVTKDWPALINLSSKWQEYQPDKLLEKEIERLTGR